MPTRAKGSQRKRSVAKAKVLTADINLEDPSINVDVLLDSSIQPEPRLIEGPVLFEQHYEIFKNVETKVKERLGELVHEYYFTGLRVAYDSLDSSNEPGVLPYAIEFGYLGFLDLSLKCSEPQEISEEELKRITKNAAIPIEVLDELFAFTKESLEKSAQKDLNVGLFIAVNGSGPQGGSATCSCSNRRRQDSVHDTTNRNQLVVCRGTGNCTAPSGSSRSQRGGRNL